MTLFLPEKIDAFPSADLNRSLYLWLAALAVAAQPCEDFSADPLRRDVSRLRQIFLDCDKAVALFPGLAPIRAALAAQTLSLTPAAPGAGRRIGAGSLDLRPSGRRAPKRETPLERALAGDAPALQELEASRFLQDLSACADVGRARGAARRRAENVATTTRPNRAATPPTAQKKP